MQYRRARAMGGTYFFTVVTYKRRRFLAQPENVSLLRDSFGHVMRKYPFTIDAIVVLPDHLHCLWTLPDGDSDYSTRWGLLKGHFSRKCDDRHKNISCESRRNKKEQAIWQRRFWEHLIRDENDYARHVNYIHYNPVKHGLVTAPRDWEFSSFHRFVRNGIYDSDWGAGAMLNFEAGIGRE